MCKLVTLKIGKQNIRVADIKKKYISNIATCAEKCDLIDKIILFGSCTKDSCSEDSDIDIAVFGNQSKGKCLTSAKFMKFADDLAAFDDFNQAYDILYFKTGKEDDSLIMDEISRGEVLYVK